MNRAIRFLAMVITTIAVVVVALSAKGADGQTFRIGTEEAVTQDAVSKINSIFIATWAYDTNGQFVSYASAWWQNMSNFPPMKQAPAFFTNKAHLDGSIVGKLTEIFETFLTNSSPILHPDKNKGIVTYVNCSMIVNGFGDSMDIFTSPGYYYIKPGVGLANFRMVLNASIPFYIPGIEWARVEIGFPEEPPFEVWDWRVDPITDPIGSDGFLYLPTEAIIASSKASGVFTLKITVFDGKFRSYDGDGDLLPETPMLLSMGNDGRNTVVTVHGGDSGRGYRLQESTDFKVWRDWSETVFVSPFSYLGGGGESFLISNAVGNVRFVRTVAVDTAPY